MIKIMKHAILILGHRNFPWVKSQILRWGKDFNVYIHWDKRFPLPSQENLNLGQIFSCNWGSFGIVRAELWLLGEALRDPGNTYFHLISDMDLMIPDPKDFLDLPLWNGSSYIQGNKSTWRTMSKHLSVYWRIENLSFGDLEARRAAIEAAEEDYRVHGEQRPLPPFSNPWTGSQWWSLERKAAEYLYSRRSMIEEFWTDTWIPDENFSQTILYGSGEDLGLVNDNLRYIKFIGKNGSCPAIWDESDYDDIINSGKVFVRKIDPEISSELIKRIIE